MPLSLSTPAASTAPKGDLDVVGEVHQTRGEPSPDLIGTRGPCFDLDLFRRPLAGPAVSCGQDVEDARIGLYSISVFAGRRVEGLGQAGRAAKIEIERREVCGPPIATPIGRRL
jgi:hypothetical protein